MTKTAGVVALFVSFACSIAWADGGMFMRGHGEYVPPILDQTALICFDGKTERLVIETVFEGDAGEYAWIIPTPAKPAVEPATKGALATLRYVTAPRIRSDEVSWGLLLFAMLVAVVIWIYAISGDFPALMPIRFVDVAVCLLLLAILAGMLLPTLGTSGGRPEYVSLHERKVVGSWDVVVLSAEDGDRLADWLTQNGFAVPESAKPIIVQYAKEGWFFTAARLRADEAGKTRLAPHPISLTFPTGQAVYPMRLTAAAGSVVSVDLFVAAAQEATAPELERQACGPLKLPSEKSRHSSWVSRGTGPEMEVRHALLRDYLQSFACLTHLSGKLTPAQMKSDILLSWKAPAPMRRNLWTREARLNLAACGAVIAFLVCSILAAVARPLTRRISPKPRRKALWLALGLAASVIIGGALYLVMPPARSARMLGRRAEARLHNFPRDLESTFAKANLTATSDPNVLRQAVADLPRSSEDWVFTNPYTGKPMIEEDSPGNYVIETTGDRAACFVYGPTGDRVDVTAFQDKAADRVF